jgi:hypothetical protein
MSLTPVANLPLVSLILVANCLWEFAAGIVDTGGNNTRETGIVDTGGNFAADVVDPL